MQQFHIIDQHTHTFSDLVADRITQSFNTQYEIHFTLQSNGTIHSLLESMKETGVQCSLMANFAPAKIIHTNNLWTLEMAQNHAELAALVSFHPEMMEDMTDCLVQYLDKGAKGVKLHPMAQAFHPQDPRMAPLYTYCNAHRIPIVFHCGPVSNARSNEYSDLENILPVVEQYRRIPFVLTHMAGGRKEDVLDIASRYPQVFFDTSIVISGFPPILENNMPSWRLDEEAAETVQCIGAHRVVFGSDFPWGSQKHDIRRILQLPLSDVEKSLILGENSLKLFQL